MRRKVALCCIVAFMSTSTALLCGCSLENVARPVVTYSDKSLPLSETAIFAPVAQRPGQPVSPDGQGGGAFIIAVDGVQMQPVQAVRVQPGNHTFTVRYFVVFGSGTAKIEIPHMIQRHVYGIEVLRNAMKFRAMPVDLGSDPNLGIYLGLKNVNMKFYPFYFK